MTYSGNPALAPDVRQRILTTFEQTLDLAEQGSRKEAILGCDFILRMDPRFQPARDLLAQLNDTTGPLDVAPYRGALDGGSGEAAADGPSEPETLEPSPDKARDAESLFGDLDELDLGDEPPPPTTVDELEAALSAKLARRDFSGVAHLAERSPQELLAHPRVSAVVEAAASRRESAPYVQKFLESARQAVDSGNVEEARSFLDKAHQLDPTHPGLQPLLDLAASRQAAAAEPAEEADEMSGWDLSVEEEESPTAAPGLGAAPTAAAPEADPLELEPPPHLETPTASVPSPSVPAAEAPGRASSSTTRSEGAERIAGLLAEGQDAFDQGQYQTAIDAWSRIFLIDVDHDEASRRIEEARRLKAEQERKAEELFHDAVGRLEAGDSAGAQSGLQEVLALQPGHLTAKEYLEQLAEGGTPVVVRRDQRPTTGPFQKPDLSSGGPVVAAPSTSPASGPVAVEDPSLPEIEGGADLPLGAGVPTGTVPLPPPSASLEVESPPTAPPPRAKADGGAGRRFLLIGSLVFVLAVALLYFLYLNRGRFFPNAREETTVTQAAEDPIARATSLYEEGQTDVALNLLRRMPPQAPRYAEARALISQWEAAEQAAQAAAEEVEPEPVIDFERRQQLIDEARRRFAGGEAIAARELLAEAKNMAPFEGEELDFERSVDQRLEPLERYVALYEGGDYEFGLPDLWRMHSNDPDNPDVRRLITGSYYNLAVTDLQRGDAESAYEKLGEALGVTPGDPVLERHHRFAEAYQDRTKDLQYRIYVKYLPVR
ncbi:MAG: hypothetical protein AAF481_05085 [Acidobacteriota bacterium]